MHQPRRTLRVEFRRKKEVDRFIGIRVSLGQEVIDMIETSIETPPDSSSR